MGVAELGAPGLNGDFFTPAHDIVTDDMDKKQPVNSCDERKEEIEGISPTWPWSDRQCYNILGDVGVAAERGTSSQIPLDNWCRLRRLGKRSLLSRATSDSSYYVVTRKPPISHGQHQCRPLPAMHITLFYQNLLLLLKSEKLGGIWNDVLRLEVVDADTQPLPKCKTRYLLSATMVSIVDPTCTER